MGRTKLPIAVTAQIAPAEVVSQDESRKFGQPPGGRAALDLPITPDMLKPNRHRHSIRTTHARRSSAGLSVARLSSSSPYEPGRPSMCSAASSPPVASTVIVPELPPLTVLDAAARKCF